MEKILPWVTDIALLVFGILHLTLAFYSFNNYKYDSSIIYSYAVNWSKGPIIDIYSSSGNECRTGYEPLISTKFPGFKEGCDCVHSSEDGYKGKIYAYKCTDSHITYDCKMLFEKPEMSLLIWRSKTLCVLRMKRNFWSLENEADNSCPAGTKQCGILDSTGNKLCLNKDETCPLNKIEIRRKGDKPSYPAREIELDSNYDLYYTNTERDSKIITEFQTSLGPICVNPVEGVIGQNNYILNKAQGPDECITPIDNTLIDNRFTLVDTQSALNFYKENGIDNVLAKLPGYPVLKPDERARLYEINYYGWRKSCHNDALFTPEHLIKPNEEVLKNNKVSFGFAIICAVHFFLVIVSILVYKILISGLHANLLLMLIFEGINYIFVVVIFIFSIVICARTSDVLKPFNHFYEKNCGDTITNSVLQWAFQGLITAYKSVIPICIMSGIEFLYLTGYYIWLFIKRNSFGYVSLSDRERID